MRRISNCLIVAMEIWWRTRGRGWLAVRRSVSMAGLLPHFSVAIERGRTLVLVDYVPRRRKGEGADGIADTAIVFYGNYRVRKYRLASAGEGETLAEAVRAAAASE